MIGYGDRARTQCLFRETHPDLPPLNQGTISKIEAQYREMGHVRKVPSKRQAVVDDDTKLNLLLALEENPITPARQLARDGNLNHKTVLKTLKYEKKRPYKMQAVQELLEDDPDRRVVDPETGKLCGPNEKGELRVKTDYIMNGYYGRDSSDSFDSDGWLKTGDIVYYDEEQCFFVVDRIKEMLKYKSWHVPPAMIEQIIVSHPAVNRAVVIGVPNEEDGDHPMALVMVNTTFNGDVHPEDIEIFVAERVPDRMKLRGGVKFIDSIPSRLLEKSKEGT
ncbi:hypothetical protein NQ318_012310 [Aromia moschata]|uniref:AMP-binding enzyme C-terminal domain-containing protein n=1 Tax=Aromia moschata TaxID=1265417 RepID=A0AAV8YK00_9CUCU|nr:hypothetical protein NQ318_012310 [Aromia moschata]